MDPTPNQNPAQQERSRRTLDALLDAAERLLEKRPYAEISLTELVGAAGVTTGALYSRFKSKNDLLLGLHQRYLTWLGDLVDEQLDASRWRGLSLGARTELAANVICQLYETRLGLLRAMVIFTRQDANAAIPSKDQDIDASSPQRRLIQDLCTRLEESLPAEERPARDDLEFAVYSALTIARENILFPGLPMARVLGLDPYRLREHLAKLLELTLSKIGTDTQ